jgi:hypothetical protein
MSEVTDFRPPDLSAKQEKIIETVADSVCQSRDPSRFQHKLVERTKHNPNFYFLDPSHGHHHYYQYLVRSYTQWYKQSYAAQTDYNQYSTDAAPTVFVNDSAFTDHFGGYFQAHDQHSSSHQFQAGAHQGPPPTYDFQQPQQMHYLGYDFSGGGGGGVLPTSAATVVGSSTVRERTPENDEDEDEAPRFRFIVENGVRKAVPL